MLNVNNQLHGNLSGTGTLSGNGLTQKGDTGNGIDRIEKTGTSGLVDTYTIYYTNGTTETYTVTNGEKGDTGNTGPKGETGEQGPQGIQGIQGVPGEAFSIYKTYASISAMNADKANVPEGKFVLITSTVEDPDNAKLYVKGTTDFTYLTDLSGATGIQGPQGEQGIQGVQGETGPKGDPGDVSTEQLNTTIENATKTLKQTSTEKSQEITDCAGVKGKLDVVDGDTYQATRDGKNLINVRSDTDITIDSDDWITYSTSNTGSSTTYKNFMFVPNLNLALSSDYYLVLEIKSISSNIGTSTITISNNNTTSRKGQFLTNKAFTFNNLQANDIKIEKVTTRDSFDGCETFSRSYIGIAAGDTVSVTFRLSALAQQPTAETFVYEPYGVSPSPDYPSDIRNVGDNINLFDKTTAIANRAISYKNGNQSSAEGYNASTFIKIKPNTKYTLDCVLYGSGSYGMAYYDNTKTYISGENIRNSFTTPSNAEYFRFGVNSNSDLDTVQLKETVENLPYTSYNCGSIDFKVLNKNKFAGWKRNQRVDPTTGAITTSNNYLSSDFCNVKPHTKYYLSGVVIGEYSKNKFVSFFDKNKIYIERTQSVNFGNQSFTTPTNAYYCIFCINGSFSDSTTMENFISDCSEIQIEKGNTATSYVSHQEQNIHFLLAEGQLLHEGDYLADDGIHSTRRTIKLAISDMNNSESYPGWNNTPYIQNDYPEENGYLNVVTNYLSNISTENSDGISINTTNDRNVLYLSTNIFNLTQTQWKSQYPNLIFELQYELAEEIVTPYTTEQAEAYYQLQHALMYKGYTLIECIDEIKPGIQVEYSYNNEINNYYGSVIDKLEERLHALEQS